MLKTKELSIRIMGNVADYYIRNNIDVKINEINVLPISKVNPNSHLRVDAVCDVCGREVNIELRRYNKSVKNGGYYSCSTKCAKNKINSTFKRKYGDENIFKTEHFREKFIEANQEKWGCDHFRQSGDWKVSHIESEKNKRRLTLEKKFIDDNENVIKVLDDEFVIDCNIHGNVNIPKKLYSNRKRTNSELCLICNPLSSNISGKEIKLFKYIKKNYDGEVCRNYRIGGKELDIYIPDLKLGIEFNGLYWHSDYFLEKDYHVNKTKYFNELGVRVIHIFEDDFDYKLEIVESILNNVLGNSKKIYGRETTIKVINDRYLVNQFLTQNHLQGFVNSNINYGLYYNGELVSMMTFMKSRKILNKNGGGFELVRFANKIGFTVIGGASKLFKRFLSDYNPKKVISYCDLSWATGGLYHKLGFKFQGNTKPNYYYVVNNNRESRIKYQKHKLVKDGFDPKMTEREIMESRGYYRIYNCGNGRYVYDGTN